MKMLNKLRFLPLIAVLSTSVLNVSVQNAYADGIEVPLVSDLQQDGIQAMEKGIPVLIEFSMHGCPFCEQVEEEVLKPMLISGQYVNKAIIRKMVLDDDNQLTDFNGQKISYDEFALRYAIDVVPTLVLMNGEGKALGLRMRGVTTIDFYGIYLDQAIDQALGVTSRKVRPANADSPASSTSSAPEPGAAG